MGIACCILIESIAGKTRARARYTPWKVSTGPSVANRPLKFADVATTVQVSLALSRSVVGLRNEMLKIHKSRGKL